MEWLVVAVIGMIVGTAISFATISLRMPQSLTILLAVVGAVAGGLITKVANFAAFGPWTFYIAGTALAIVMLAGGILAFSLTNEEKRI